MRVLTIGGVIHDVMISKASWGTMSLLFVPRDGGKARSLVLPEESQFDAERALAAMTDEELVAKYEEAN